MANYILEHYGDNLLNYFNVLSKTGKTAKVEPFRFLIVGFLNELMNSSMAEYITECDYKAIAKILDTAMGVSLMPYYEWENRGDTNSFNQTPGFVITTENRQAFLAPEFFTRVYRTE